MTEVNIPYQHILLVTDLLEDSVRVAQKAKAMIDNAEKDCKVSVLHIVEETVLTAGYEIVPIMPVGEEVSTVGDARAKMTQLLQQTGIHADEKNINIALSTRRGILDYTNHHCPDLVVIGRHKRTGLASLLGATADDILPGVHCDVLVVYLGDED